MSTPATVGRPMVCVADYEREASNILGRQEKDYFDTGAAGEQSLRENVAAFRRLLIRWRVLRGIDGVNLSTTVLGQRLSMPVGVAPTGFHGMAHPSGEVAMARACARHGAMFTLSTFSNYSIEEVAEKASDCPRWFQLYMSDGNRSVDRNLVKRAEQQGYSALVLTIDCSVTGNRYVDCRRPLNLPPHLPMRNFDGAYVERFTGESGRKLGLEEMARMIGRAVSWEDVAWLRSLSTLPVIVKGVMTAEDAREAVRHGARGIWVSNHGARQLDTAPAPIEALPEVVAAVGDDAEVYVDGGVRCGTDILKALALGARAVFVGRPALWGLACGGEDGVSHVLDILREELSLAMTVCGCANVRQFPKDLVVHQDRYRARL